MDRNESVLQDSRIVLIVSVVLFTCLKETVNKKCFNFFYFLLVSPEGASTSLVLSGSIGNFRVTSESRFRTRIRFSENRHELAAKDNSTCEVSIQNIQKI